MSTHGQGAVKLAGRPLKIAVATQGYQSAGGVQTVARWLVHGLRDQGHSVHIFNLATSREDSHSRLLTRPSTWRRTSLLHLDESELDVTHVGCNGAEFEVLRYRPRRDLDRALTDYDLVQVIAGSPALASAVARSGRPLALQVATTVKWERAAMLAGKSLPKELLRRAMTSSVTGVELRAMRSAGVIMVENREMARHVARHTPNSHVLMAPPGVDVSRFTPRAEGWDREGYLLSVCRLADARKGLHLLVEAYAAIREARPQTPGLVLAGRNDPPAALTDQIRDLGLMKHVRIRNDVPAAQLPTVYRGASVYLQTSFEEGLGISVLEAMAAGLPVVATDTAGTRESVVDGVTGWLVPQGVDVPGEVAAQALKVLDDQGAQMPRAARERVATTFSTAVTLQRFLEGYSVLLTGSQG